MGRQRPALDRFLTGFDQVLGRKFCGRCRQEKSVDEFFGNRSAKDGKDTWCKPCKKDYYDAWYAAKPGRGKAYRLVQRYGISVDEALFWLTFFGKACPLCIEGIAEHLDHDHATGRVRGVLCFNCNQMLGNARDDAEVLRAAIRYLEGEEPKGGE